ncbi:ATP synthase F1 subunit delta [Pedobacter puniceum]|jgi:F-type H+-transporting ATPase subunit delta|uniref:ATP synthase subunit delta n=1 Tax=Pedobacter puniceum TaxID=2666136 RepID=A0A7K0FMD1_9SPHI|nr:ATP synthase F1 subunit delta [Pedobacter puniceum]MRX47083.1 ATP synthase F1 subunit delta [Pedobacter puniceum]
MSEIKVASRYAKSLIDLAIEQNALEQIKGDMQLFVDTVKASIELQTVLKNPIIPISKKNSILVALFGDKVHATTKAFLKILIDKGRAEVLFGTSKEFLNQYNQYRNIVTAKVTSAVALSDTAKADIIAKVKEVTGGEVILNATIDESLIGGFVLTVGDKQFDASISSKLNQLKKDFAQRVVA